MTHKPRIGVPCRGDISGLYRGRPINAQNVSYLKAIIEAGGVPFLIPVVADGEVLRTLFTMADGILLTGGGDVDPGNYRQAPSEFLSDVQPDRDRQEITLIQWCLAEGKPLFGICRGIQVMTVAAGGSLWQDLARENPRAQRHDYYYNDDSFPRDFLAHQVRLEPDSVVARALAQETVEVNSLHHQAVRDLLPPFRVVGRAGDGVVEAIEAPGHPFAVGVQWHPEELLHKRPEAGRLFSAFVSACVNGR